MAIVWLDGFNNSGSTVHSRIYDLSGNFQFNVNGGRYDGGYIQLTSFTGAEVNRIQAGFHKTISNATSISVGIAISNSLSNLQQMHSGTDRPMVMFYNGASLSAAIQNNMIAGFSITSPSNPTTADFSININNRSGNLLSINVPYFNPLTWNFIEIELVTGVSTGAANIYLNGKLIGSVSGVNFSTSTSVTNINRIGLLPNNTNGNIWYDDFYVTNSNTRLGEIHISTIRPSADTAQKDWTPSTGSTNFNIVGTSNYEFANYVTTNDHNKKDIYDLSNLSTLALQTSSLILATRTSGAGYKLFFGGSNVSLLIKSGSTESVGTGLDLYEGSTAIFPLPQMINETNPNTTLAWTISDINNLQIGIKTN